MRCTPPLPEDPQIGYVDHAGRERALHHALAGADSSSVAAFVGAARANARFAELARLVAANVRAGADLYSAGAWALADEIVAATFGASPSARLASAVDANGPTFERTGPGTLRIQNIRPIYLGMELETESGARQEAVLDAATYDCRWSVTPYVRVPSSRTSR